ncbi:hypothetical protein ABIE78_000378 [Sinorhizobium fredii]|uniref:Uncharacterized protein y4wJ n=4 Tax=Sinorhizobium TaxID=28105 RepID=I3XGW3_SINF2|nr:MULTISPECIES: hypothetical protein [Sinorhizobium]MCK3781276.1 hypothetical protein [Ensifer sesbaniae]AFL55119.1 uncharacterized protein y4wJ [Sinorhizobium fredii USDA 257]KSV91831.1 hypothetical protein N181_30675 [Sinorhizobium fredii USDA 205]MQW94204.1 hypothetical protein [Sinorhizobium fredii]MQX10208.1 hypothetical protein [Sinorhizobium fredii]
MARADVERFVNDLDKGRLPANLKPSATGLAPIVAIGKSLGYNITLDEVQNYIRLDSRRKSTGKKLDAMANSKRGSRVPALPRFVQSTALDSPVTDGLTRPLHMAEKGAAVAAVVQLVVIVVHVSS